MKSLDSVEMEEMNVASKHEDIGMNSTGGMILYPDVHWGGSKAPMGTYQKL